MRFCRFGSGFPIYASTIAASIDGQEHVPSWLLHRSRFGSVRLGGLPNNGYDRQVFELFFFYTV